MVVCFLIGLLLHAQFLAVATRHVAWAWLAFATLLALLCERLWRGQARWPGLSRRSRRLAATIAIVALAIWTLRSLLGPGGISILAQVGKAGDSASAIPPSSPGIILRPKLTPVRLVLPRPRTLNLQDRRQREARRDLIPFRGVYWVYQPPDVMPPIRSPEEEGSPDQFRLRSTDLSAIRVTAREEFPEAISIGGSNGMELEMRSAEEAPPSFLVRLLVVDRRGPSTAYFRSRAETPSQTGATVRVRFPWPSARAMDRFDKISVDLLPERDRAHRAPRVALLGFRLY